MDALPFADDLFAILVCPECRQPLKWVDGRLVCTDASSRRVYRVEEDIPVMLIEESEVLAEEDWRSLMDRPGPVSGGGA